MIASQFRRNKKIKTSKIDFLLLKTMTSVLLNSPIKAKSLSHFHFAAVTLHKKHGEIANDPNL